MTKSEGHIAAALREHAEGSVREVGRPRISMSRWLVIAATSATAFTLAFASGTVISGTMDGPGYQGGRSLFHPERQIAQVMPLTPPPLNGPLRSESPAAPEPNVPYLTEEFFDVAADAIRHNAGVNLDEANDMLDLMEDAGQHCVRTAPGKSCIFNSHGVRLDFRKGEYRVTYERYSKDGSVDLGDRLVGAIQKGDTVEVIADPRRRVFPVPVQRP